MNFNHLIEHTIHHRKCSKNDKHYWKPTGTVEASVGDNVRVDFYCKHCGARHTEFLTMKTYRIHERIILNSIGEST